ncbi:MAG: FecR family protein [Flavobacterium sp.]|nr:MAG: FecR family protein [Flavobacterium sp.]
MKKKDLISKWLNFNLSDEELETFNNLDVSSSYHRIDRAAKHFKAPDLEMEASYDRLKKKLRSKRSSRILYYYVSGIAATLLVAFGLFYFLNNSANVEFLATHGENTQFTLPDNSEVILNSGSIVSFNQKKWTQDRQLKLDGEAYFKVAKGETFTVSTAQGSISVLGTEFKVNDRKDYFEVSCYEGLVKVFYNGEEQHLSAGNVFKAFDDRVVTETTTAIKPTWLDQKSTFKSIPYRVVLKELERQFDIEISGAETNSNTLFTGSFNNENLETALQAVTIPLNLSYTINGKNVVLKINQQ